ncbi:putative zinc finger protein [Nonomuraea polychroma]|uniref:Putative zinc finger protein n=1 Tax=Nonomuraea polychroma TaxID=46176 RepID=A0A438LYE5_9ACTN|nr:zf-HC2 domain-containing protein [Nonomuraea polychroma]RVX38559.1 putative zinc finger protein [Nonomuraea polychroma]
MKRFTCGELVEVITAYLDDALDQPSRAGVELHLTCCEDCGHYVDQFRATIRALADPPPEKLSDRTRERLMSAFRNRRHA